MEKKFCSNHSAHAHHHRYICNPRTGRWVRRDGPTGQAILNGWPLLDEPKWNYRRHHHTDSSMSSSTSTSTSTRQQIGEYISSRTLHIDDIIQLRTPKLKKY